MTDTKEIAFDALRQIYEEAEPGLDFDHLLENPEEYNDEWYDEHFLDEERQKEILNNEMDKHNLTSQQESEITITVILNYGPRGHVK